MAKWQASKADMSPRKGYIPEIEIDDNEPLSHQVPADTKLVKCECVGENAYWVDCPKIGHEEGCYASVCLMCGEYEHTDCEEVREDDE
jgi:hypothetical protein